MKTLLLAIFAVACLAGQAAIAQAPLPRPKAQHHHVDARTVTVVADASR